MCKERVKSFCGETEHGLHDDYNWVHTAEDLDKVLFECMGCLIYTDVVKSWNKFTKRGCRSRSHAKWFYSFKLWCLKSIHVTNRKMRVCFNYQFIDVMQERKSEILWTWLNMRKIETFSLGLCLCEECCLFASVFFILQTWVPLGY